MKLKDYEKIKDLPETTDGTDELSKKEKKDKYLLMALAEENPARLAYDKLLYLESSNPGFIMNIIPKNKNVIKYMSESLKQDEEFLTDVVQRYPGSIPEVLKNCNVIIDDGKVMIAEDRVRREEEIFEMTQKNGLIPYGADDNEKLMSSMIAKDAAMILLVSDALKDNKEFIKVEALKNKAVLNEIINNVDEFGIEGLNGAREANVKYAIEESIEDFEKELSSETDGESLDSDSTKRTQRHIKQLEKLKEVSPEKQQRYMKLASKLVKNKSDRFKDSCDNDTILEQAIIDKTKEKDELKSDKVVETDEDAR